jgi:hypothetical protein
MQVSVANLRNPKEKTVMDTQELNKPETEIEDLTVSEDTAAEVKGSFAGPGAGEPTISSFNFMKKCDK